MIIHKVAIAALIWASDLPAATAFSIKASEIAEFDPSAKRSGVNGIPNFCAISLTLSWLAITSASNCVWVGAAAAYTGACWTGVGVTGKATGWGAGIGTWTGAAFCPSFFLFLWIAYWIID